MRSASKESRAFPKKRFGSQGRDLFGSSSHRFFLNSRTSSQGASGDCMYRMLLEILRMYGRKARITVKVPWVQCKHM